MAATDGTLHGIDVCNPLLIMQRVADQTLMLVPNAEGALVGLSTGGFVTYVCGSGYHRGVVGTRTDLESSIGGLAVRSGKVLRCDDTETDPRVDREVCRRLGTRSTVCLPLSRAGNVFGLLAVGSQKTHGFDESDVAWLEEAAELISLTVGIAGDVNRVQRGLAHIADASSGPDRLTAAAAGSFLLNVLNPRAARLCETRRRVEGVLADPDALSMVFQPIFDISSGSGHVVAVEALSRFDAEPRQGPDVWFSEANETSLGTELELLAVAKALAYLPVLPDRVALAINVGPAALLSPGFLEAVGADPGRIVVELTETAVVDDYSELTSAIMQLRERGLRLAVDDTGAGYAGLVRILRLVPNFIKLDRELVSGIDVDPVRRALATALVSFAAESGAQIIAEGIETEDELDVIRHLGVPWGQGFHLGRPAPLDAVLDATVSRCTGSMRDHR